MNKFSNCKNLADYLNKIDDLREKRKSQDRLFSYIEEIYKKDGLDGILDFAKSKYSIIEDIHEKHICKDFLHEDFKNTSYIGLTEKLFNEYDCSFIEKVIDLIYDGNNEKLISNAYITDITKFTDIINEQKK